MSIDIKSIKRKLLIKYPPLGSTIARLDFQENNNIRTAATNGKVVYYNSNFVNGISDQQKTFLFAHEVCHVACDHILRSEGKVKKIWNIATDAVINKLLEEDGFSIIKGGVDIAEAINYNAEEMYNKILKEQQEQPEKEIVYVGHASHELWEKAIEDRKKEKENSQSNEEKNSLGGEPENDFAEKGEQEIFKQSKLERIKSLQELSKELADISSHQAGTENQREGRKLSDIGIAAPLIDWRKHLRQAIKNDEDWTRKNARMRNGYFRHRIEQIPMPETEILLDTSGSVSENLLRNFLRECKNILSNSKVRVGCFNTEFHGFTELRRVEDIDNMSFPIGGGTDFNPAVEAFSRRTSNKIIFTDGEAPMPQKTVNNVIWVVFGKQKINPKGGKVINITDEQLRKLYNYKSEYENRVH